MNLSSELKKVTIEFNRVQNCDQNDADELKKGVSSVITLIDRLFLSFSAPNPTRAISDSNFSTTSTTSSEEEQFVLTSNDYIVDIIVRLGDLVKVLADINPDLLLQYSHLIINCAEKSVRNLKL
jgi:hypothetical protein